MDVGCAAYYDWGWLEGELNRCKDDVNSTPEQNFSPWTDGSNLRSNLIAAPSDPFYPYGDGSVDIGIDQETLQETIKRIVEEQFKKVGIDSDRYVKTMDLARIEKYKMKHR